MTANCHDCHIPVKLIDTYRRTQVVNGAFVRAA